MELYFFNKEQRDGLYQDCYTLRESMLKKIKEFEAKKQGQTPTELFDFTVIGSSVVSTKTESLLAEEK